MFTDLNGVLRVGAMCAFVAPLCLTLRVCHRYYPSSDGQPQVVLVCHWLSVHFAWVVGLIINHYLGALRLGNVMCDRGRVDLPSGHSSSLPSGSQVDKKTTRFSPALRRCFCEVKYKGGNRICVLGHLEYPAAHLCSGHLRYPCLGIDRFEDFQTGLQAFSVLAVCFTSKLTFFSLLPVVFMLFHARLSRLWPYFRYAGWELTVLLRNSKSATVVIKYFANSWHF